MKQKSPGKQCDAECLARRRSKVSRSGQMGKGARSSVGHKEEPVGVATF